MGIFGKKGSCIGSCDRKLKAGDVCVLKTKIITTFSLKGTEKQLINFVYLLAIEKDENYYEIFSGKLVTNRKSVNEPYIIDIRSFLEYENYDEDTLISYSEFFSFITNLNIIENYKNERRGELNVWNLWYFS